jgi:hypothetical protein
MYPRFLLIVLAALLLGGCDGSPFDQTVSPKSTPETQFSLPPLNGLYEVYFDLPKLSDAEVTLLRSKVTATIDPPQNGTIEVTDGGIMDSSEHLMFYVRPNGKGKFRIVFKFSEPEKWPATIRITVESPSL